LQLVNKTEDMHRQEKKLSLTRHDITQKNLPLPQQNIGNGAGEIRVVAGLGILSLTIIGPQSPWAYLGVAPLLTGLFGWCPP
jgi:Protein of unknown function (DUF2892)